MSTKKVETGDVRKSGNIFFIVGQDPNGAKRAIWFSYSTPGPHIREWDYERIEKSEYVCNVGSAFREIENYLIDNFGMEE